jgi:hypothetical protein
VRIGFGSSFAHAKKSQKNVGRRWLGGWSFEPKSCAPL